LKANDALIDELADTKEQLAAAQSKEVCTVAHDDEVMEFCPYCKIERLTAELAAKDAANLGYEVSNQRLSELVDELRAELAACKARELDGGVEACTAMAARVVAAEARLAETERVIEFVRDLAEGDCTYKDNCPPTARHYRCYSCKARAALDSEVKA
jgi:hypothetical protein